MIVVVLDTLRMPRYSLVGGVVAFAFCSIVLILPQWATISAVLGTSGYTFVEKIATSASLVWWSLTAQYGAVHMATLLLLALLTAIAIALALRDAHARVAVGRATGLGFIGALIGALGIGCSACGAAFLTSILGVSGATWVASRLPMHGTEFSLLGILLLLVTIKVLTDKFRTGAVCNITV